MSKEDFNNGICEICGKEAFVMPLADYDERLHCATCMLWAPSPLMELLKDE